MSDSTLAAVPPYDEGTGEVTGEALTIPAFEGEEVNATKAKITSVAGLEIGDRVFRMDESVKLVVEARVVGIDHKPGNGGSAKLERIHTLKAIDSMVIDWHMDLDALRDALAP